MIALVIALVVVTLLGPAAGYFFASKRLRRRNGDHDLRVRQLEDELRRLRGGPAWAQQSGIPAAPPMPAASAPNQFGGAQQMTPQQQGPQHGLPAQAGPHPGLPQQPGQPHGAPPYPAPSQPRHRMPAGERFAQEPPLFGDGASSGPPPQVAPPTQPQVQAEPFPGSAPHPQHPASRPHTSLPAPPVQPQQPSDTQQPAATQLPPGSDMPQAPPSGAPQAGKETSARPADTQGQPAPRSSGDEDASSAASNVPQKAPDAQEGTATGAEPPDPKTFTPVSDIIDKADAAKLDWLGHVSAGRRVRLKRLGYDVPEKLANLRRSEIRRLARELSVSEEVIRNEWVPAAEAYLKDRHP